MNGIHDVGGMQDFGPVPTVDDGVRFQQQWEGRTFAMHLVLAAQGVFNLNQFRDRRERIPPRQFLEKSYYDLWLTAIERLVAEKEVAKRAAEPPDPDLAERMARIIREGRPVARPGPEPRFKPGDRVRARNIHPTEHTRMPRYVRGKVGEVDRSHACFDLPDASAAGRDLPEPLYTVRFDAVELWGPETARAGDGVRVDLWESYLEEPDA